MRNVARYIESAQRLTPQACAGRCLRRPLESPYAQLQHRPIAQVDVAIGVQVLVLAPGGGGDDGTIQGPPRDYWEWDGVNWHKLAAPSSPTFRGASAVTDPFTNEVFLWSLYGEPSTSESTFWRWNGSRWSQGRGSFYCDSFLW